MRVDAFDNSGPFLTLIDRLQVMVYESAGLSLLMSLQQALVAKPAVSHIEFAVIRGVVGRLAARAVYEANLDGASLLLRVLEADSVTALGAGIGALVSANVRTSCDARIERVLEHLREHYLERESSRLEKLAAIAQVTPTHLSRLIRKSTGDGIVAYTRKLRITHAAERLALGRTLSDVALEVGYRHQADFSRDFQRVMGVTPGRFVRRTRLH